MQREARTIRVMIEMYCHDHHGTQTGMCAECLALAGYAHDRLRRCPFQEGKTTCVNCPVHCYRPEMRDRVRAVMRYSGPRMMLRHPALTTWHLFDGRRKEPVKAVKNTHRSKRS
jgi:hypothetical protein